MSLTCSSHAGAAAPVYGAAEAAGVSGVATALLSLVTVVSVRREWCRCCRIGGTLQDQLVQQ